MNLVITEHGWLAKDDTIPWNINDVPIAPETRTRNCEYAWAAERCIGSTILDAATGYVPGWHVLPYIIAAIGPGKRVVATDMNPATLEMPPHPQILRSLGNIESMPYADASFDTVCCISTLEHMPMEGQAAALKELCRVAKHRLLITADEAGWLPKFFGQDEAGPADGGLQPEVYCMQIEIQR